MARRTFLVLRPIYVIVGRSQFSSLEFQIRSARREVQRVRRREYTGNARSRIDPCTVEEVFL